MSLCTEEEAKERWCPFIGVVPLADDLGRCIASQCMAWRWEKTSDKYAAGGDGRGFCGLASDPNPLVTALPISALNMPVGKP